MQRLEAAGLFAATVACGRGFAATQPGQGEGMDAAEAARLL